MAGDDIPMAAKLVSIADAYDAMTSERAFRSARTPEEARDEIAACTGTQFDPELAERFCEAISDVSP